MNENTMNGPQIVYELEGDQWSAHLDDFENMQESPLGFGNTQREAFDELIEELAYLRLVP